MIRRVCAVAVCALLAFPGAVPVAAARPGRSCWPDEARVWHIRRQGTAPHALEATLHITATGEHFKLLVVAAETRNGRWSKIAAVQFTEGGGGAYPYIYGGDAAPVTSPDRPSAVPAACDGQIGGKFDWTIVPKRGKPTTHDWFVATVQGKVTMSLNSGWTVTELKPDSGANLRIYRNDDGDGAGAAASGYSIEHFTGVTADGGRYGSLAHASLPCAPLGALAPDPTGRQATGWGAATLLGGDSTPFSVHDRYLKCDGYDIDGFGAATAATKWNLQGEAIGKSVVPNRLTILDFPKPNRGR